MDHVPQHRPDASRPLARGVALSHAWLWHADHAARRHGGVRRLAL